MENSLCSKKRSSQGPKLFGQFTIFRILPFYITTIKKGSNIHNELLVY